MSLGTFRLDGEVALVTGAAQGIGRAVSLGLAQAGADIAVTDLPAKMEAIESAQQEIERLGRRSRVYGLDVRDVANIRHVVDQVVTEMGKLDILVNNAGVRVRKPAVEMAEEEWDYVLDVNLKGLFFCAQAAARHMLPRGHGRIINVASQLGITAMPNRAGYCASKGGVINLTRALALEWVTQGVTVNAIGPGPTDTPMTRDSSFAGDEAQFLSRSPIGRRLTVEEIVGAAIYLASPAASGVNGHTLIVDGGWTAW